MDDASKLTPGSHGAIAVSGPDAGDFLRAQLTNDVLRIGEDRHLLTAWCDAKGRAVMVAHLMHATEGFLLILSRALIESVLKRLRMYVLRARVELADLSETYRFDGVHGDNLPAPYARAAQDGRWLLGLPRGADNTPRALAIGAADGSAPHARIAGDAWELDEIDAGVPTVVPATQGLFVPQMLNLHWLHAIDFDKGCYPGQEVIARLHYRGRLTRRLYRLAWHGARPEPGDEITANGVRVGTVVRAATTQPGAGRLLAVLRIDAAEQPLMVGESPLERLNLPYATPA